MTERMTHYLGIGISAIILILFFALGTGVVTMGALTGLGMFGAFLLVAIKTKWLMEWCVKHCTATEILSTLGTFMLFSVFGGGTATAGVASATMCLLVSAVLGCSKLGWLSRAINSSADSIQGIMAKVSETQSEPGSVVSPKHSITNILRIKRSGRNIVSNAIAEAVRTTVQKEK